MTAFWQSPLLRETRPAVVTSEDEASRPQVQETEDGTSRPQVLTPEDQGHAHEHDHDLVLAATTFAENRN